MTSDLPPYIQVILVLFFVALCALALMTFKELLGALREWLFTSHEEDDDDDDAEIYASTPEDVERRKTLHKLLTCERISQAEPLVEIWQWSPARQEHILVGIKLADAKPKSPAPQTPMDYQAAVFEAGVKHGLVTDPDATTPPPLVGGGGLGTVRPTSDRIERPLTTLEQMELAALHAAFARDQQSAAEEREASYPAAPPGA